MSEFSFVLLILIILNEIEHDIIINKHGPDNARSGNVGANIIENMLAKPARKNNADVINCSLSFFKL
ncbi:hypothetical protein Q4R26_19665 [Morganella morganii]